MIGLLLIASLLHPVHETLSEVEWNGDSKRLEVAIRLHQLDEQWLKKRYRRQGGEHRGDSAWAMDYVSRHIRVAALPKVGETDDTKYRWIGRQIDGAHVWWYFEIETKEGSPPDCTNRVLILNENPKRSLSLTKKRSRGSLKPKSETPPEP